MKIRKALERDAEKGRISQDTANWLLEYLDQFPEKTWNMPDNRKGNYDFSKARLLHEMGYAAIRFSPIWADGSFRGYDVRVWHSEDMMFPKDEF